LRSIEGSREITESSLAHGRNDVPWSKSIGEDNQADVSASTSDFAKQLNILWAEHFPPGDDQVEWLGCRQSESMLIVSSGVNGPAIAGQNIRKQIIDIAPGCQTSAVFWSVLLQGVVIDDPASTMTMRRDLATGSWQGPESHRQS